MHTTNVEGVTEEEDTPQGHRTSPLKRYAGFNQEGERLDSHHPQQSGVVPMMNIKGIRGEEVTATEDRPLSQKRCKRKTWSLVAVVGGVMLLV